MRLQQRHWRVLGPWDLGILGTTIQVLQDPKIMARRYRSHPDDGSTQYHHNCGLLLKCVGSANVCGCLWQWVGWQIAKMTGLNGYGFFLIDSPLWLSWCILYPYQAVNPIGSSRSAQLKFRGLSKQPRGSLRTVGEIAKLSVDSLAESPGTHRSPELLRHSRWIWSFRPKSPRKAAWPASGNPVFHQHLSTSFKEHHHTFVKKEAATATPGDSSPRRLDEELQFCQGCDLRAFSLQVSSSFCRAFPRTEGSTGFGKHHQCGTFFFAICLPCLLLRDVTLYMLLLNVMDLIWFDVVGDLDIFGYVFFGRDDADLEVWK